MDQDNEVEGLIDGSTKMITDPKTYSVRLLADPNSPSSLPLFVIRVILVALVAYYKFQKDSYFDEFFRTAIQDVSEQTGFSITELRSVYSITFPIIYVVGLFLLFWIGSWIMGLLIKRSLHPQSPLKNNTSRAMRQLNGYRQVPLIIGQIIALTLILTVNASVFIVVMLFVRTIAQIMYGVILWRGIGTHVGYNGSLHKYIAGTVIFFALFQLL